MTRRQWFILSLLDFQSRAVTLAEISDAIDVSKGEVLATVRGMVARGHLCLDGECVSFPAFVKAAA